MEAEGGGGGEQEEIPRVTRRQSRQHSSPRPSPSSASAPRSPRLSPTTPPPLAAASATLSATAILRARERGAAGRAGGASSSSSPAGFGAAARAYLTAKTFAPTSVAGLGDNPRPSRAYVGFYTDSGNLFVCGYQNDRRIRVYECGPEGLGVCGSGRGRNDDDDGDGGGVVGECGWRLVKDISCRLLRWTVTDALCVPGSGGGHSEAKLLYSTISPTVHAVTLSSQEEEGFDEEEEEGEDDDGGAHDRGRR